MEPEAPTKRNKWRRRIKKAAVIVVVLFLGYRLLFPMYLKWQIELILGTSIPDDATNVKMWYFSFQGGALEVRFDYPPQKINNFLAKTCFSNINTLRSGYQQNVTFKDWFHPEAAQVSVGGKCGDIWQSYEIVIDMTDPSMYTIYLSGTWE